MVKILAGEKGEGKTKRMIDMANAAGKEAKGNIVFVDDDNSHMYDLHYSVRFVEVHYGRSTGIQGLCVWYPFSEQRY